MRLSSNNSYVLCCIFLYSIVAHIHADTPCKARIIPGQSFVCVCNDTYCDEVTRHQPDTGQFVTYTSSESGARFQKATGNLKSKEEINNEECCEVMLELNEDIKYQTIEGFGGAVTDSAAINWMNLSDTLKEHLIDSYFSEKGIQYNMLRVPIGGCDFSTRPYAYNELPENDTKLTNYTLAPEDYKYKIPMIKQILNASVSPIHIVATTWSPPKWMKTNDKYAGASRLRAEYYQTYADYHLKFLQKYAQEGINVWGITTTNEPTNGVIPLSKFNSLGWTATKMGKWIIENLGPTIRNSSLNATKIITVDDQRYTIPYWFNVMVETHPRVIDWIDGVGVHYYGDSITPASFLSLVADTHPDKFILATEACEGSFPWEENVILGSWSRARHYATDIISDLNHHVVGWLDWNLCLDEQGGPNWDKNYVDSPIIVFPDKGEFIKQPMFYAMGHFSKFIPRGSKRIHVVDHNLITHVKHVAVVTPYNTTVLVLYNKGRDRAVKIKYGDKFAVITVKHNSLTTVEFPSS